MELSYKHSISVDDYLLLRKYVKWIENFYKKFGFNERPNYLFGAGMDLWVV